MEEINIVIIDDNDNLFENKEFLIFANSQYKTINNKGYYLKITSIDYENDDCAENEIIDKLSQLNISEFPVMFIKDKVISNDYDEIKEILFNLNNCQTKKQTKTDEEMTESWMLDAINDNSQENIEEPVTQQQLQEGAKKRLAPKTQDKIAQEKYVSLKNKFNSSSSSNNTYNSQMTSNNDHMPSTTENGGTNNDQDDDLLAKHYENMG